MKHIFILAGLCLGLGLTLAAPSSAQDSDADPATRDQVEIYLRTVHSHDVMQRMLEAMLKPMHQIYHDQFAKDGKKLPPEFETRFNKMMDDLIKGMPMDEMTQAMVPAYQKHFTKGDIENLTAFYASPTGQKVLQEMPEVTGESMQAAVPLITKYMEGWKDRMQKEMKDMEEGAPKAGPSPAE
jgi:hypothetical protein